jgi:23S rRNA pseudouridine1911/1915/1917 synthase
MRKPQLDILFEDEHLLALNKQPDLLTLPDRFNAKLPNLRTMLTDEYGDIFVVHRLDKQTSGVILFAKDAETHRELSVQFQTRNVRKLYHAIVGGVLERDEMEIDIPIEADPVRKGLMRPSVHGKPSLTIINVLKRFRMATLLSCELVTGRTHQIRVHCATIGHPLLVDADYGTSDGFYVSSIKRRYNLARHTEERPLMSRLTLHSAHLELVHPFTQEPLVFEAPYPKDFNATLQVLEKYCSVSETYRR